MPRTTVDLDTALIQQLKHLAADARQSMSQVVNRLLQGALKRELDLAQERGPLQWNVVPKGEPAPGFDPASRDYMDLLDKSL
ncbi:MAG: hypothetical protein O7G29_03300 [Acidobacteria bacterium]|nr:hypothetical protein [Acidobacteriota bacterium]